MNIRVRIAILAFTSLIILASQISIPFAFAPSLTSTIVSSGAVVYPRAWANDLVVYSPISAADASFIASNFSLVDFDFDSSTGFAQIKALNPNMIMVGYEDLFSTATSQSYWNTVNANESWFLHTKYGNTSAYRVMATSINGYIMDFSNSGWRNFIANWCASKLAANPMIDGIFADNVQEAIVLGWNSYFTNVSGGSLTSADLPTDIVNNWNSYMIGMIQTVKAAIGSKLLIINSPDQNGLFIQYCDGQMIEGFMHAAWKGLNDYSQDPISGLYSMSLLANLSATGKIVMAFSGALEPTNPTSTDLALIHQCMLYCLSGFLLAYSGRAGFGFQMLQYDYTGQNGYWPEMDAPIGVPSGAKYNIQSDLWTRDFTNGKVFLNVGDVNTYTVNVAGINYSVAPRSGLIVPS